MIRHGDQQRAGRAGKISKSRRLTPSFEGMEPRLMLSGTPEVHTALVADPASVAAERLASPNYRYLKSLEASLMTGELDPAREAALLRRLDAGVPRSKIVAALFQSPEFISMVTDTVYQEFLKRSPTAAESRAAASILKGGGDSRSLFVSIASSPEYVRTRGGGTSVGYVRALYNDVLHRAPRTEGETSWVSVLNTKASRTQVVRSIVFSTESLDRKVKGLTKGTPDADSATALARDLAILRTPGGLTRLRTELLSTPIAFERATQINTTHAPINDTGPVIHPPGLPMSPVLELGTRWTPLDTTSGPTLDGTNLVAAGADGSIWVTGPSGHRNQLYVLTPAVGTPGTWRVLPQLPYTILYFSAISNSSLYAVAETSEQTPGFGGLFSVDGSGNVEVIPTPSGLSKISAATDGTLLALSGDTVILRLPGESNWTTLPPSPLLPNLLKAKMVAVGSKDNIYATFGSGSYNFLFQYTGGKWDRFDSVGVDPMWISATSDGALWAWDFHQAAVRSPITGNWQVVDSTIVSDTDGVIKTTPVNAPEAIGVGAAISQNRLVLSLSPNLAGANTVQVLSLGVADRAAVPLLPTDPQTLQFYNEISAYLNTPSPDGIRGIYDTTNANNLGIIYSNLVGMPEPADVNSSNRDVWKAIYEQIKNEITYAVAVQGLFASVNLVHADIKTNNATDLPSVVSLVSAGVNIPSTSNLTLWLENGVEALLWGLAAAVPGAGAIIGSILASAYGSVVSLTANDPTPDSNTTLDVQYGALVSTLDAMDDAIDTINLAYETAILTDWSRLTSLGQLLVGKTPVWDPPIGSEDTVADDARPAFKLFFYQTLMPAKWQIVSIPRYTQSWDAMCYICSPGGNPYPPSYDLISQQIGTVPNTPCEILSFQFLNQVGSNPDPYSSGDGPYPTDALLQAIYDLGISQQTLFTAGGGFNMQIVAGPSGP